MFDKNRFRAQLVLIGMTMKELAEQLGIDESTLYRKVSSDGNFTREEINRMISIMHIEDPMGIFFARKLAFTQDKKEDHE